MAFAASENGESIRNKINSALSVHVKDYGSNTTPGTTDMTTAFASAITALEGEGGGILHLDYEEYLVSEKIQVSAPIMILGKYSFFANIYQTDGLIRYGTWITMADGANEDVIEFIGNPDLSGSGYPRLFTGLHGVGIYGNRSGDQDPTVNSNNTGRGVVLSGASYVSLRDVNIIKCGSHGVEAASATIGGTSRSCNNLDFAHVRSISNTGNGFDIAGGDSHFSHCVGGYNGNDGINTTAGPVTGSRFWNNFRYGAALTAFPVEFVGNAVYDNQFTGIRVLDGDGHIIVGNNIFDNGRQATGTQPNDRAGIAVNSSAGPVTISGNNLAAINFVAPYDTDKQLYGISATSGTPEIFLGQNTYSELQSYLNITNDSKVYREVWDYYAHDLALTTTPATVLDASTAGAVYEIIISDNAGASFTHELVRGHATTPTVTSIVTNGTPAINLTVSGTNIQAATASSSLTAKIQYRRKS